MKLNKSAEDCISEALTCVSKAIIKELSEASKNVNENVYTIGPLHDITGEQSSRTLQKLLEAIHKDASEGGPVSQIINSILLSLFTQLSTSFQCMLGGYFRNIPVKRYEKLSRFKITCSYEELKRLRTSSAKFAIANIYHMSLPLNDCLLQVSLDNFDLDLNTPTGKAQTHSLGMIVTKNETLDNATNHTIVIPRIHHSERGDAIPLQVNVERYNGPKNPTMILMPSNVTELDNVTTKILHDHAALCDMNFLKEILSNHDCPEFNGFNTKHLREMNLPSDPKTVVHYRPLIDMKPAEPDTMLTGMCTAMEVTEQSGQEETCDHNL